MLQSQYINKGSHFIVVQYMQFGTLIFLVSQFLFALDIIFICIFYGVKLYTFIVFCILYQDLVVAADHEYFLTT